MKESRWSEEGSPCQSAVCCLKQSPADLTDRPGFLGADFQTYIKDRQDFMRMGEKILSFFLSPPAMKLVLPVNETDSPVVTNFSVVMKPHCNPKRRELLFPYLKKTSMTAYPP